MTQPLDSDNAQPLSTTSALLVAVRLKSANKYIFRALLSLGSAALLIRVMGMINQIVITARFGQGEQMDAYFVASAVPLLLASLLASGLEGSVIPAYTATRRKETKEKLFSILLNLLVVGLTLFTVLMLIFRNQVIAFSAPALDSHRAQLAISLAPYIFPVLLLMVVNSFIECLLNAEGKFGWPAYAGILVPLATAVIVLIAGSGQTVVILCIGTIIGQLLQLCVIIIRAWRAKIVYRPILKLHSPELTAILMLAWPSLVGALISQAGPLVDQMFASSLAAGSISALNYSLKLISVPTGVIFASTGRAILPYLSQHASINDFKGFKETLRLHLWIVGIGTVVLTALLIVLAHPLVQILFQRGAFSATDTDRTASTLLGFVIGLTPMAIGFIVARAFTALRKNRLLMYVTTFSVVANAFFDFIFSRWWQSFGIALATSAVYFCTMFILLITLQRKIGKLHLFTPPREVVDTIGKFTSVSIPYEVRRQVARVGIIISVFAAGIAGVILNSLYALRIAIGPLVILTFLRYRYLLLITWVLINAFIGSNLQFFNGNNFLSGLTIPTLLLMFLMPLKQTFKRMPALAFLFIYFLWVFASIGISAIGVGSFLTLWTTFLDYMAVGVLTINVLTTRRRMMWLIDAILLPATFIALYGIYGYFTKQNGLVDPTTSLFRISSIFDVSPTLALFLSIVIPLAIYRTFTLQGFKRIVGVAVVLILLVALGMTFARGPYISTALSIIVMILFLPSHKLKIGMLSGFAALAALIVLVIAVGKVDIFSRFFNQDISTLNGRTLLWQAILNHFDPTQLLGNGLKASDVLLTNLRVGYNGGVIATAAHDIFLGALYDHGIIGLILLVLVFIALFASLIRGMRKATGDHRILFVTALATLVSVFVQSFQTNDIWIQAVAIYFWIVMALPFALYWFTPKQLSETDEEALDDDEGTQPRMRAIQKAEWEQVSNV